MCKWYNLADMKFMKKRDRAWVIIVFILLLFLGGDDKREISDEVYGALIPVASIPAISDQVEKLPPTHPTHEEKYYSVIKVIDGDTVNISKDGETITFRLIGLDTPETVHPSKPVECFGKEASDKAKAILTGKQVRIEMDPSQGIYDKYGRTLAYIYLEDGTHFNKYMIEEGYGHEYTYDLPYKYQTEFKQAQQEAKANERGLWAPNICDIAIEKPKSTDTTQEQTVDMGEYICSSNVYNCGDFSTHSEAQTAYDVCGGVGNDIHRLDQDKDGEACESLP